MAEKRMFARTIIDSDAFLDMPVTSQLLYFHLSMRADDDGFVNKPKSIMRMCSCKDDDLKILFMKKFLIPFESGVVVIKHWKIHNYIRKDTYTETTYKEEKSTLELDENGAYRIAEATPLQLCNESVTGTSTQIREDKIREDKIRINKGKRLANKEVEALFDEIEDEGLKSLYIDFYEMRKKMKAPMTEKAVKLLINKVGSLEQDVERQKTLLNEAILHGWKSVYPLKDNVNARESSQEALSQADRDFVEYLEGR